MLLPEFSAFFRYSDLYPCKPNLNRRLELYTPLHAIKEQLKIFKTPISDAHINQEFMKLYQQQDASKTEEEKEKEAQLKKKKLKRKLISIDKALRNLEFFITVELGDIIFSVTEKAVGNHKLVDVGISG